MKGGSQTVTTAPDPRTQAMQGLVYNTAAGLASQPYSGYQGQTVAGVSPLSSGAAGQVAGVAGLAGLGAGALGGNQQAIGQFMNPYQQQVIDATRSQFGDIRAQGELSLNDAATRAGAFGGSRHGVALGQMMGDLGQAEAQTLAGLNQSGFNDAMQRAYQAANLGLGAAGQSFGMGDYFRNVQQQGLDDQQRRFLEQRDWGLRNLGILQGAMGIPHGMQQTTPMQRNVGAGVLGGAATGASLGSVIPGLGTAAGAGIGGLLGLFG